MREIKFRAWGKNSKEFLQDKLGYGLSLKEIQNIEAIDLWEFSQYTGLKDKNGKEIYEGDIVKGNGYEKTIVEFKHGAFIIGYHNGSSTSERPKLIQNNATKTANRIEVIGNIYENPELLSSN